MELTLFNKSVYAHIWDAEELIALKDDPAHQPTWIRAEEILELSELKPYCTANSFEKERGTTVSNIARWNTFVIEFDDHEESKHRVSIEEQRKFWKESDLPHTLRVYSGNSSIHVIIRMVEDLNPSDWKKLSAALQEAFPTSDHSVLRGAERFCRMPKAQNLMTGKQQNVEYIGRRIHRKELVNWLKEKGCYVGSVDKPSLPTLHTLHNNSKTEKGRRVQQAQQFLSDFDDQPYRNLYHQLVEHNFIAKPNERNRTTIDLTTFLFRATNHDVAIQFTTAFYWYNCQLFTDPLENHMKEATTHWNACDKSYPDELNELEREIYSQLRDETERALFRICRDLANNSKNGEPKGRFPLSAEQCRIRLGLKHDMEARRLLQKFINLYGILRLNKPGKKRAKGQPPRSNVYQWLLKAPTKPSLLDQESG